MTQIVVALAGRRIDAEGADSTRFPLGNVAAVKEQLRKALEATKPAALVCAAACGADLLALSVAGELGIRRRVVLPASKAEFRASSVVDRPGAWGELFDLVVAQVEGEGDLVIHELGAGDEAYRAGNLAIFDAAEEVGDAVEAWIVWNGQPRSEQDITLHFADEAWTRRLPLREILTLPRSAGAKPDYEKTCFVAMPFGVKPVDGRNVDFDAIYSTIIAPAVEQVELPEGGRLRAYRTDRDPAAALIDEDMFSGLEYSRFMFCDLTGLNINVGLELGVRFRSSASGTVVFRQPGTKLPFDIAQVKVMDYDTGTPVTARQAISNALRESLKQNRLDSPVRRALAQPRTQDVDVLLRDAENALRNWDAAQARLKYMAATKLNPSDPTIWLRLATLEKDAGSWKDAAEAAKRATDLTPDYGEAWREYGVAQNQLHRRDPKTHPDDGIASLRKAIGLNPKDFDALASLGGALKRQNKREDALEAYRQSLLVSDNHPYPLLNVLKLEAAVTGHLELEKRKSALKRAAQIRQQQVQSSYDLPWSLFDLIELRLYQGRGADAVLLLPEAFDVEASKLQSFFDSLSVLKHSGIQLDELDEVLRGIEGALTSKAGGRT